MELQPQAITGETVRPKRKLAIDDASIDFLGRAARSHPLPEDSLTQMPVRQMTAGIEALVTRLTRLNVNTLIRHQGVLSRLTGADIEARMRFEVEVRQTGADIRELEVAGRSARRIRQDLQVSAEQIGVEQNRLNRIIGAARRVLDETPVDTATEAALLRQRFERRLNNLVALEASNTLTLQQIAMASGNMALLIDRVGDVCTTVFALWQRDALAVAMSAKPVPKTSPLVGAFLRSHDALLAKLAA